MVGGEFFLVGECGLECSGEFNGVPVGEKLCPLVGLWITLGVKLEIEPISEADPVLILEKSEKKIYKNFNIGNITNTHINNLRFVDCLL